MNHQPIHRAVPRRPGRAALLVTVVAALASVLASCAPRASRTAGGRPAGETAPGAAHRARLLLVNDVYVLDTLRDGSGGLSRVVALRDSLARDGRVLFILAGDVLAPSLLSKWYAGEQMIDGFNAARLDYATFGNHEFELVHDTLVARIQHSRFRWIGSNCKEADGRNFPGVRSWDTVTVDGVRIGLFGLTLPGEYRSYVKCADPEATAHAMVDTLRAAHADAIVAITHQTLRADSMLLAREPQIAAILGGHEHEKHRIVVNGRGLLKADASSRSTQLLTLSGPGPNWTQRDQLFTIDRGRPMDSATERVVQAWRDTLVRRLGPPKVIATTPVPLDARDAIQRRQETVLGDLVTDGMRLGTNADVALINSGALRLDDVIAAGPITNYQLESIFLFADETRAVTFPLTGARLRELLEHSVANVGSGPFLQLSGVHFRYDRTRPAGARIVGDLTRDDGSVIAPAAALRVSFVAYPACLGGDGYRVPEAADACRNTSQAPRTVDLLMQHISQRLHGVITPPPSNRIIEVGR